MNQEHRACSTSTAAARLTDSLLTTQGRKGQKSLNQKRREREKKKEKCTKGRRNECSGREESKSSSSRA